MLTTGPLFDDLIEILTLAHISGLLVTNTAVDLSWIHLHQAALLRSLLAFLCSLYVGFKALLFCSGSYSQVIDVLSLCEWVLLCDSFACHIWLLISIACTMSLMLQCEGLHVSMRIVLHFLWRVIKNLMFPGLDQGGFIRTSDTLIALIPLWALGWLSVQLTLAVILATIRSMIQL